MGVLCGFRKPATRRLRRWPVKSFESWLIFYRARRDGVEIVQVMHGARDIESLLEG
jgi:toxin ParE1/3/4